jgi:hypothetical protein
VHEQLDGFTELLLERDAVEGSGCVVDIGQCWMADREDAFSWVTWWNVDALCLRFPNVQDPHTARSCATPGLDGFLGDFYEQSSQ